MRDGWVGIHKCGGLIEAVPNSSQETYKCSVHTCSNRLSNDEYFLFEADELPQNVDPVVVKSMNRSDRKKVAEADEKRKAVNIIQEFIRDGRVNLF